MDIFLCPFAPETLVSRGFGRPVPRQPNHFLNLVLTRGIPPTFRGGVHTYRQPPSGQSRVYRVTQMRTDGVHCREFARTVTEVLEIVPVEGAAFSGITMDHFLSFWYLVDIHVVVVVDSHIQRIVLATEETTVTQQVSHRPIKCQSRLWSQKGTKVNGSHHGNNPLLRPTGIQIATKKYAPLQVMAPTNVKTVHQTSLLHIESNLDPLGLLPPTTTSVLRNRADKLRSNHF